ncbi:MAG: hypothetical protein KBD01_06280 [Acidobacteria bacterium]|nr:hypothetical protein [Acidobacteriota bacterium]
MPGPHHRPSRALRVTLLAVAACLLLLLVARWGLRRPEGPPRPAEQAHTVPSSAPALAPATVPAPARIPTAALPAPFCWTCPRTDPPLKFQVDLDLLAPLGNGTANAALWFRDFAKPDGSRSKAWDQRVDGTVHGESQSVYPPDSPLLLEAEPWVDQSVMRFYPDVWPAEGFRTPLPNLLHAITLAKSWVARGEARAARDPASAKDDFRRAVRLGRLLLQDDVALIANFIGWSCVRLGATALYDQARHEGDLATMVVAGVVLNDCNALRKVAAERMTRLDFVHTLRRSWLPWRLGRPVADIPAGQFDDAVAMAKSDPSLCLRLEAQGALAIARVAGNRAQRRAAETTLEELTRDRDPLVAASARANRGESWDDGLQ